MRVHNGTMERRMGGRTDGSMHGWMDGRKDIWMDRTERLIGASQHLVRDWNSFALDKALNLIIHFFRFWPNLTHSLLDASRRRLREGVTEGRTGGQTNGRTDRPSYRDARTQLKIQKILGLFVFRTYIKTWGIPLINLAIVSWSLRLISDVFQSSHTS